MLEVRNVTKTFGALTVLRQLSLSASSGDVALIVGANGAGKSTLLRVAAGLARPDAGDVVRHSTRIGFLSHHLFLYGRLSVAENLRLFAEVQGVREIGSVLERMDLTSVASRPVAEVSKGTQARVGIARAFLGAPEIVLLDEPTSNLDERGVAMLLGEIARVRDKSEGRATVLIATHDLYRLGEVANRALVVQQGAVVADSGRNASQPHVSQVLERYREVNR